MRKVRFPIQPFLQNS